MKTEYIPQLGSDSLMDDLLTEKRIGYKVAYPRNSKSFEPATSAALQRITYRVNHETRKVRGDHGPLAIFETLEQARKFRDNHSSNSKILLVEYEPSNETELWKKLPPVFGRSHGHMTIESAGTTERAIEDCPAGTILADSVYVLEVLE